MNRHAGDYLRRTSAPRAQFADDSISLAVHAGTHVDALAHLWYGEELYNGFPRESVTPEGARHCGAERLGPLVGRGVLLDFAEEGPLEEDRAITGAELEQRAEAQGVEVGAGDVVLLRTGWWTAHAGRPGQTFEREPGPDLDAGCWLAERDVAVVGADNFAFEAMPNGLHSVFAVHELLLRDCGIPILEGLALDDLANERVYEFLFVAAPLQLVGATGSPVNPLAIA
jgi:kynurenine formamidase